MYYEIKLRTEKENAKGETKEVTEHYMTDAELFSEAELKGLELYANKCDVFAVSRSKVREIVNLADKTEENHFFKATITDVFTDDSGNEKETKYFVLVAAKDIPEANKRMEDYLRQGFDMKLDGIVKTKILDVI